MSLDLSALWDFNQPELSELRFRAVLTAASGDDALILRTQIARTFGLRGDFDRARQVLAEIEPQLPGAGAEARARFYLETGRTYASAAHDPQAITPAEKELARAAYLRAVEAAQAANLDDLAIDGLHMLAFVDTAPEEQIAWNRKAIEVLRASTQPGAQKWAGPLHNNTGYALHQLERYEEALEEFRLALAAHEQSGSMQTIRIAYWMVAWTLRAMDRLEEALEMQLRLEKECDAAGEPDPYVFEELELLYQALEQPEQSSFYAARRKASL